VTESDKSKLPRRFAVAGILVGLSQFALSWCIDAYNVFHLPTSEQLVHMGNFSTPPLYWFLTSYLPMVTCPAIFPLGFAAMESGRLFATIAWILAALINAPIYYLVGLFVDKVRQRMVRSK
jgi:hypothetical protein